jgi:hypothetical protein
MLSLTEIREKLKEQNPRADLMRIDKGGLLYIAFVTDDTNEIWQKKEVFFIVQLSAIGDKTFTTSAKSGDLLEYMVLTNKE